MKNYNAAGSSSQRKRPETITSSERINKKKKTFKEVVEKKTSEVAVEGIYFI